MTPNITTIIDFHPSMYLSVKNRIISIFISLENKNLTKITQEASRVVRLVLLYRNNLFLADGNRNLSHVCKHGDVTQYYSSLYSHYVIDSVYHSCC